MYFWLEQKCFTLAISNKNAAKLWANKKCLYLPTLSNAIRQNLTKGLCNVNKRVKLISCFKLEYWYQLSVLANIGPKISVIGI